MLKKVLLAATVSGLVAGIALPVPSQAAAPAPLSCKEAAKLVPDGCQGPPRLQA
jgi:hypothetical protein